MKRDERLTAVLGESEQAAKATFDLLRRYVLQETVAPLRSLATAALFRIGAALLAGLGLVILLLAVLRVLQTETGSAFAGSWSFAPYLLTAVLGVAFAGFAGLFALRATGKRRTVGGS